MKKRLLISLAALFLMGMAAKAQSFEFQYHGTSVPDGGMVIIEAVEDDFGFGEMWCETNPSSNPDNGLVLKLLSGTTASGSATVEIEHNSMNPTVLKWCMGGDCMIFGAKTSLTKNFSVTGGLVQTQFDAENAQSTGYLLATLTATIGSETHSVKIQFTNGETAGITSVEAQQKAGRYYTLDGRQVSQPTKGLYILNGKKVIIK